MINNNNMPLKNDMANQLYKFHNYLYGCKREIDDKMKESFLKICDMVDVLAKEEVDDFDLWVFLKYRKGKMRSKYVKHIKLEPKTLLQSIDDGFELPNDTTLVEIEIKPVLKKDYNVRVVEESISSIKFGLGKEDNLTLPQLKRRYGLTEEDNLFTIQDFEASRILKFYNAKTKAKEHAKEIAMSL